ncbi:beta strand repeat-containing protein, partial [Flavobacterium sp.]|uniref:beta strand repeat-containing protein n=1 Tax=Flavobacterium sp. TaxID=239 RepID=UPI0037BF1660
MKNLKLGLLALLFLLLASKGYSQVCAGNKVTITLQNITNPTTTTLEFDVYIANTGTTTLRLASLAGGVNYNAGMLPTGATGTLTCIDQPTALNFPNFTPIASNQAVHTLATKQLKWQNTPVSLASGNTVNLTSTPLKFARFRFTSSLPWTANFAGTLTQQYLVQGGYTQMVATVYCNGNSNSTGLSSTTSGTLVSNNATNSPYPITLNACANAASQTASTAVSCFGGIDGSSTITMSTIPSILDITYTVDGGTSQNATLTSSGAFTVTGLTAGSHTIVISNSICSNVTATGVIIAAPTLLVASGAPTVISCYGGNSTVVVTATGGTAPYTGTGSFPNIAGAYSYTVTDTKGCTSIASGTITQPTALVASATPSTILCNGGSSSVVVTATGGTTPYTGTNTFTHAAGAYSYTVTDFKGCTSTATGTISQPAVLTATAAAGVIACNGGTTDVTVSPVGGTAPYTISPSTIGLTAGTYSFTITDFNNCTTTADVTITQPDALTATATADSIACNGGTTDVTVTPIGGTIPYTITPSTIGLAPGTYTFTITDFNYCTTTADVTITQPDALTATATAGTIACYGGTTDATVTPAGGTAPYTITPSTIGLTAGSHTFTITDFNNCTTTANVTITQPDTLTATATAGIIACYGGTTDASVTPAGGTAPYTIAPSTVGLSAGTFTFTITDFNNCTTTANVTITEPDALTATATSDSISCNGGTTDVTVTPTGGTAPYTISPSTVGLTAGTYTFTITDFNNCTTTADVTITQPDA